MLAYPWEMRYFVGRQLWLEDLSPPTQYCLVFAECVRTHTVMTHPSKVPPFLCFRSHFLLDRFCLTAHSLALYIFSHFLSPESTHVFTGSFCLHASSWWIWLKTHVLFAHVGGEKESQSDTPFCAHSIFLLSPLAPCRPAASLAFRHIVKIVEHVLGPLAHLLDSKHGAGDKSHL